MKSQIKNITFTIVLILILYLVFEFLCFGIILFLKNYNRGIFYNYLKSDILTGEQKAILQNAIDGKLNYFDYDPLTGWTHLKNRYIVWSGDNTYKTNSSGIRSDREYSVLKPKNILRISAFGDSFTHCDEVSNKFTWENVLEKKIKNAEVLNFGVSGFEPCQAYLRYQKDGKKFNSDVVLICFLSENINRAVNQFRPFLFGANEGVVLTKPRYILENNQLKLLPNPIQKREDLKNILNDDFMKNYPWQDYWYQRFIYNKSLDVFPSAKLFRGVMRFLKRGSLYKGGQYKTDTEAFKIVCLSLKKFYNNVKSEEKKPVIIIFPNKKDMLLYKAKHIKSYEPLLAFFKTNNIAFVDLMDGFKKYGFADINKYFALIHYNELGNKIVADEIEKYLKNNSMLKTFFTVQN